MRGATEQSLKKQLAGGFLSTLPVRGATVSTAVDVAGLEVFLSTLPVRGATPPANTGKPMTRDISIHAPREGSDRRADGQLPRCRISIHAPREGSDIRGALGRFCGADFYPRSP